MHGNGSRGRARHPGEGPQRRIVTVLAPVAELAPDGEHQHRHDYDHDLQPEQAGVLRYQRESRADHHEQQRGQGLGGPGGEESGPLEYPVEVDRDRDEQQAGEPGRGGAGTSTIAVEAGVDLDTVLRCLGRLAGYGFIERCDRGWRLRRT